MIDAKTAGASGTIHHVIIGASSAIAKAVIRRIKSNTWSSGTDSIITAISRSPAPDNWSNSDKSNALWLQSDYEEQSINRVRDDYAERLASADSIIICNGILHDLELQPEKRLAEFSIANFQKVLHCNTMVPLLWLQKLQALISRRKPVNIAVFSARVASIEDNHLGGWYSYRSSKAALNMLVKNFAIEMSRTRPRARLFLFHPGTTDTPLSQPFQKNVPAEKLFTPDFVAQRLLTLMA
ncbi:MAG: SDR family NAD(P)-dependent oxidoreductase, partial [Pseudomonadota bacterium]|nr:SDR family NAD(P)-dependent oxidoreductase [Pseudomonadota bacterium]